MARPLVIEGANKVFRAPEGVPNCYDIYVRHEVIDGVSYHMLEVELDEEERKHILAGGTLVLSQMGNMWVPLGVGVNPPPRFDVFGDASSE